MESLFFAVSREVIGRVYPFHLLSFHREKHNSRMTKLNEFPNITFLLLRKTQISNEDNITLQENLVRLS